MHQASPTLNKWTKKSVNLGQKWHLWDTLLSTPTGLLFPVPLISFCCRCLIHLCNVTCLSEDNTNRWLYLCLLLVSILLWYSLYNMHMCCIYTMGLHSGRLYWILIGHSSHTHHRLYILFTLWQMHVYTDVHYNNWSTEHPYSSHKK